MDVIGFLCVSLGSRHACACSEAGFSSENGDRAWGLYYRRAAFCCMIFLWAKWLGAKDIHKEMFTVGSVCHVKLVHNWVKKFSEGRSKVADDARPGAESAETTIKILLCCGFRCTDKAMGQAYQWWWRICWEINVFYSFEYHMFYVWYSLFISDLFTDSPTYL
jgi:hypothetical protein